MGRYLKSVSMKAFDGNAIRIPICCEGCKEDFCKLPCQKFADAVKGQECSHFEMVFGVHEDWWDLLKKIIIQVILAIGLVIAGCNLSMNMKEVALCDLESKSKRIEERSARITNSLCNAEVTASNVCRNMNALSACLSVTSNSVVNLRSELSGLHNEIALCSNAVNRIWWWWK